MARLEYDAGTTTIVTSSGTYIEELRGSIFLPEGSGPFPIAMLLHGKHVTCRFAEIEGSAFPCPESEFTDRIDSYLGYDYIAAPLASHGYVVVTLAAAGSQTFGHTSLDPDGRAQLLAETLDLLAEWNSGPGPSPVDGNLIGKLDFTKIGMMGHSRGGEGVSRFVSYNKERTDGPRYPGLRAVLAIAPTAFTLQDVRDVAFGTIQPLCDGDVFSQDGVWTLEHTRKLENKASAFPRVQWVLRGANHNYFNTVWAPDDDAMWSEPSESCNPASSSSVRLSTTEQQEIGKTLVAGFLRRYLGGETAFDGLMTGAASLPPGDCPAILSCEQALRTSYLAPASDRTQISNLLGKQPKLLTADGGAITATGFVKYETCDPTPDVYSGVVVEPSSDPCPTDPNRNWTDQFTLAWEQQAAWSAQLTGASAAPAAGSSLHLRAAINQSDALNSVGAAQDFDIRLTDTLGTSATVAASAFTPALEPVSEWTFNDPDFAVILSEPVMSPNIILSDIRVPLNAFGGVDLAALSRLELLFGTRTATGSIQLLDVAFQAS